MTPDERHALWITSSYAMDAVTVLTDDDEEE